MTHIIGLDPGPMVGAVLLKLPPIGATRPEPYRAEIAQITPNGLWALIAGWLEAYDINAVVAERFVVGHRASRVNDPKASEAARDVLGGLAVSLGDTRRIMRSAAEVKPWATDRRLDAAGLLDPTKGMRHARDAARHALYSACADFGARVPRTGAAA